MFELSTVTGVARVIQLAIAPVFLLSAIGAMLAVMTNRLGRIIDRARVLEMALEGTPPENLEKIHLRLRTLSLRAKLVGRAITLCTTTAILVCTVIIVLFLSAFLRFDASKPVAVLFILAMLAFVFGLIWFLREIFVASSALRIGPH